MNPILLLISIIAGILLGNSFLIADHAILTGALILIISSILLIIIGKLFSSNPLRILQRRRIINVLIFLLPFAVGTIAMGINIYSRPWHDTIGDNERLMLIGVVISRVSTNKGEKYALESMNNNKIFVFTAPQSNIDVGDYVRIIGRKISSDSIGNYHNSLRIFAEDGDIIKIGERKSVSLAAFRIHQRLLIHIDNSISSKRGKDLIKALLLGERGLIDSEMINHFRDAGLSHILALSGLHISIIAMILFAMTRPLVLLGYKWRYVSYLLVILGIWSYTLITGLSYSSMRAALMVTLGIVTWVLERPGGVTHGVVIAAVIILLISPSAIFNAGFQMSFISVMAISIFVPILNPINKRYHPLTHTVCSYLLTTLVAAVSTSMLTAYWFGHIPIQFLSANLIILPCLPYFMIGGILHLLLTSFGIFLAPFNFMLNHIPDLLNDFLEHYEGSALSLSVNEVTATCFTIGLLIIGFLIQYKRTKSLKKS